MSSLEQQIEALTRSLANANETIRWQNEKADQLSIIVEQRLADLERSLAVKDEALRAIRMEIAADHLGVLEAIENIIASALDTDKQEKA